MFAQITTRMLVCLAFFAGRSGGQSPPKQPVSIKILNEEAGTSDQAGIRRYSADLLQMILPKKAGRDLISSLSERLARAEEEARGGKRELISETDVAQAFNEMMSKIGAPNLRVSAVDVARLRIALGPAAPSLISRKRNKEDCNPGESLFLVELLLDNTGLEVPPLQKTAGSSQYVHQGFAQPEARARFDRFVSMTSKRTVGKAFTQLAGALNF
jgi:hypothetical protein